MAWFVYLLECRGGHVYTGIAVDVQARLEAHRAGHGARYTRMHPPERLLTSFVCADRSEATRLERAIKQLAPTQKRALCDLVPGPSGAILLKQLCELANV